MKTQTEKILNTLRIIAWIGYVGSLIIFGLSLIFTFFSFLEPNFLIKILMKGQISNISLSLLREKYEYHFISFVGFYLLGIFFMVKIWELAKTTLSIINLRKPFSFEIAKILEKVAFYLFCIWVISCIGNIYMLYLQNLIGVDVRVSISIEFSYLFGAGLIYLISQIFKRGVEIQEENELTV